MIYLLVLYASTYFTSLIVCICIIYHLYKIDLNQLRCMNYVSILRLFLISVFVSIVFCYKIVLSALFFEDFIRKTALIVYSSILKEESKNDL